MSVAYEPRSFIHDGGYPTMDDDPDHHTEQRFTDSDVAELSHYTQDTSIMPDDRVLMVDDPTLQDAHHIDLDVDDSAFHPDVHVQLHEPQLTDPHPSLPSLPSHESKDSSPAMLGSPPSRVRAIPKPEREVTKHTDGKFHCPLGDCAEEVRAFSRKCEWNKHMDKHERPYRCEALGCENLPGFTYSGGLLRHEREVHNKHGGPKNTVRCPHENCKRHTGKGFSRQENLNEHLRRVHTNPDGGALSPPTDGGGALSPDDNDSERSGMKRKRQSSVSSGAAAREVADLRQEMKRVREENEQLKADIHQQSEQSLAMMAQIAELQAALGRGMGHPGLGAPTAQMI